MDLQIVALKDALPFIPAHQKGFAESLIDQHAKKGKLSEKQWFWVTKLANSVVPNFGEPEAPEAKQEEVGSMQGLIDLFKKAGTKLKFPAIVLQLDDGTPVRLHVSGKASKTPGYVQVTNNGSWGSSNVWFGRVSPVGVWEKSPALQDDSKKARKVKDLLAAMSLDPAKTAAEYGCLTGNCCFCGKKLTDEKSTAVGYGKTCAANYSLPWGKAK